MQQKRQHISEEHPRLISNFIVGAWAVNGDGYELVGRGREAIIRERRLRTHRLVNPAREGWLFEQFSPIETGEQALAFAAKYGLLGVPLPGAETLSLSYIPMSRLNMSPASKRRRAESLDRWLIEAELLRLAVRHWQHLVRPEDVDRATGLVTGAFLLHEMSKLTADGPAFDLPPCVGYREWQQFQELETLADWVPQGRVALRMAVNARLRQLPIAPVLADSDDKGLGAVALWPVTLLSLIWLQFAQAIASIETLRRCEWCGSIILVGWNQDSTAHGKRTNRRVCGASCRTQLWRHRRRVNRAATDDATD